MLARGRDHFVARREIESRDRLAERFARAARELHLVGVAAEKGREARRQALASLRSSVPAALAKAMLCTSRARYSAAIAARSVGPPLATSR